MSMSNEQTMSREERLRPGYYRRPDGKVRRLVEHDPALRLFAVRWEAIHPRRLLGYDRDTHRSSYFGQMTADAWHRWVTARGTYLGTTPPEEVRHG